METKTRICWTGGLLAAIAMTLLSLYPEASFRVRRGADWQGTYAIVQADEPLYEAYLNALLSQRPRRNDPLSGSDDRSDNPQPETYLSIQVVPAYLLVGLARFGGLTAAEVFVVLAPLCAFLSTLALFWLLATTTRDNMLAAVGAICVLCLGTLAAGQGVVRDVLQLKEIHDLDYLPFLRRYQPSATFPLFFFMCGLVWHALTNCSRWKAYGASTLAGLVLALLIFSYFYLWTAAAAWVGCLALGWLIVRPAEWRSLALRLAPIAVCALCALVPYAWMIAHRFESADTFLIVEMNHVPDLFRLPEVIGVAVLVLLSIGVKRGHLSWSNQRMLFVVSFALVPLAVFNQQILTGYSLQPIHYEVYIANYVSLLALVTALPLLRQAFAPHFESYLPRRTLLVLAFVAFYLGWLDVSRATAARVALNDARENIMPVARRLTSLDKEDNRCAGMHEERSVVFAPSMMVNNNLSATAPQAVLYSTYTPSFPGIAGTPSRERFYQYLYLTNVSPQQLYWHLYYRMFEATTALFSMEHAVPVLAVHPQSLTTSQIEEAVDHYTAYLDRLKRGGTIHPRLSYMVVCTHDTVSMSNLDRWYQRDAGEQVGIYTIYRLKLRQPQA